MKNNPELDPIYQEPTTRGKNRATRAIYQCGYCQQKFTAVVSEVISGHTRSCGCLRKSRRNDHTKRVLATWGSAKTKWVGIKFLSHSRLSPKARATADAKLMKSLNIKDRDILFKAAVMAQTPISPPLRKGFDLQPSSPALDIGVRTPPQVLPAPVIHPYLHKNDPKFELLPFHDKIMAHAYWKHMEVIINV
jgi:hypothetical protein